MASDHEDKLRRRLAAELAAQKKPSNGSNLPSNVSTVSAAIVREVNPDSSALGARGLLAKRGGALKKHADNKFQPRALIFLAAIFAIPALWFGALNDASKPKPTPTLWAGGEAVALSSTPRTPTFVPASFGGSGNGGALIVTIPPRPPSTVPVAVPIIITATPAPVTLITPSSTWTPSPTPFLAGFWVSITLIDPDASAANCYPGRYGNNRCNTLTASGVDWRLMYGRGAGCPSTLPLGSEVITQSGAIYVCIDRTSRTCVDAVCPLYVFFPASDDAAGWVLFERAFSRSLDQLDQVQ